VYLNNLLANPSEEKFRRIRKDNRAFQDRVAKVTGGVNFLKAAGFTEESEFWAMGAQDDALLADGVRLLEEYLATL
jgi:UBX domain-containing protein 6